MLDDDNRYIHYAAKPMNSRTLLFHALKDNTSTMTVTNHLKLIRRLECIQLIRAEQHEKRTTGIKL